jgi:prefoldin subunit 5
MARLAEIEAQAAAYRRDLDALLDEAASVDRKIRRIRAAHAASLREKANRAENAGAELERLVAESPQLFEKPRTQTFHGVTVGYQKGKATLAIADEAEAIRRIEEEMPDKAPELIKTEKKLQRGPLGKLRKAVLDMLGVRQEQAPDRVVVRPSESDGVKMAREMLTAAELAADQDGVPTAQEAQHA